MADRNPQRFEVQREVAPVLFQCASEQNNFVQDQTLFHRASVADQIRDREPIWPRRFRGAW